MAVKSSRVRWCFQLTLTSYIVVALCLLWYSWRRKDPPYGPYIWQFPAAAPAGLEDCSVSRCFKSDHGATCAICREHGPAEGDVPPKGLPIDVERLRRWRDDGQTDFGEVWPPLLSEEWCRDIGERGAFNNGDPNKKALEGIGLQALPAVKLSKAREEKRPRLMCILYTTAEKHYSNVRVIRETWGSDCDGFLVYSTESDPRIPAVVVEHKGPEAYENIWQKVRSIWKHVHENFLDRFDFFMIGGHDIFILPENVREYLIGIMGSGADAKTPEDQFFLGHRFQTRGGDVFNSGGSGYILSRGTLRTFMAHFKDRRCSPDAVSSMEDVYMARCLKNVAGLEPYDTRDERGRERFHPFAPSPHYNWKPAKPGQEKDWYENYSVWGIKLGADCCAPDSVSFHYLKRPAMVRHIFSILYPCRQKTGLLKIGSGK